MVLQIYALLIAALVLAPIAVVVAVSLSSSQFLTFPPPGLSVQWYTAAYQNDTFMSALETSLLVGLCVSALSSTIGVMAALGIRASQRRFAKMLRTFFLAPLALPTIVLGIAILALYQTIGVRSSPVTMALGQALIGIPYVVRLTLSGLSGVDTTIERAATNLGASPWRRFWRVTFPLARGGIVAGAIFSFIVSLDDVNIALFLSDIHTTTLPVALFSYVEQNADPLGTAVASFMVLLAVAAMFLADRLVGIEWLFGLRSARARNV